MKRLVMLSVLVAVGAAWPVRASAQMRVTKIDDPPRIAEYVEFGGNTGAISANLDVLVASHTSIRGGGLLFIFDSTYWNSLIMVNQLFGTHGHYLEVGAGFVATGSTGQPDGAGPTLSIGYRLQTRQGLFRLSAASTPARAGGHGWRPMLGMSVGKTF